MSSRNVNLKPSHKKKKSMFPILTKLPFTLSAYFVWFSFANNIVNVIDIKHNSNVLSFLISTKLRFSIFIIDLELNMDIQLVRQLKDNENKPRTRQFAFKYT